MGWSKILKQYTSRFVMSEKKPVILAMSDGKAGHETQTQGLIQVLNHHQQYEVEWVVLQLHNKLSFKIIRFLLKFFLNTAWLKYFLTLEQLFEISKRPVRYIVSAGGNTLVANALLKKYLSVELEYPVQNIVASSLRGVPARCFDAVFTIHVEQKDLAHYVYYPIAPNKMTASLLTQDQARKNLGILYTEFVITILIGADTKNVKIGSAQKWAAALLMIRQQYPAARILLSSSRRSSVEFEQQLSQYVEENNIFHANDQIVWVAQGQSCDIKDFIKAADWILASPDSTSMTAEVIMAEKKLVILDAEQMSDQAIQSQLLYLQQQKQLIQWDLNSTQALPALIETIELQPHSQLFYQVLSDKLKHFS